MTWTVETLREHQASLAAADQRFHDERDRRYAEVAQEREKALKIKETADLAALELAREIQTYKDEKANELREQINSERGLYATKNDVTASAEKLEAMVKPLADYVSSQTGRSQGISLTTGVLVTGMGLLLGLSGLAVTVYFATH